MSKTIAINLLWMLSWQATFADGGIQATYHLVEHDSLWTLEMRLSPGGIEQTMTSYLDQGTLRDLSRTEYDQEILEYIKNHFRLKVDGRLTRTEQQEVKINEREAYLQFALPDMPKRPRMLEGYIPMFSEQGDRSNWLSVDRRDAPLERFELSRANNYRVRVAFTNGGLIETNGSRTLGLRGLSFYAILFIVLGIVFWVLTKTLWSPSAEA